LVEARRGFVEKPFGGGWIPLGRSAGVQLRAPMIVPQT
jgi:hypothetical protein